MLIFSEDLKKGTLFVEGQSNRVLLNQFLKTTRRNDLSDMAKANYDAAVNALQTSNHFAFFLSQPVSVKKKFFFPEPLKIEGQIAMSPGVAMAIFLEKFILDVLRLNGPFSSSSPWTARLIRSSMLDLIRLRGVSTSKSIKSDRYLNNLGVVNFACVPPFTSATTSFTNAFTFKTLRWVIEAYTDPSSKRVKEDLFRDGDSVIRVKQWDPSAVSLSLEEHVGWLIRFVSTAIRLASLKRAGTVGTKITPSDLQLAKIVREYGSHITLDDSLLASEGIVILNESVKRKYYWDVTNIAVGPYASRTSYSHTQKMDVSHQFSSIASKILKGVDPTGAVLDALIIAHLSIDIMPHQWYHIISTIASTSVERSGIDLLSSVKRPVAFYDGKFHFTSDYTSQLRLQSVVGANWHYGNRGMLEFFVDTVLKTSVANPKDLAPSLRQLRREYIGLTDGHSNNSVILANYIKMYNGLTDELMSDWNRLLADRASKLTGKPVFENYTLLFPMLWSQGLDWSNAYYDQAADVGLGFASKWPIWAEKESQRNPGAKKWLADLYGIDMDVYDVSVSDLTSADMCESIRGVFGAAMASVMRAENRRSTADDSSISNRYYASPKSFEKQSSLAANFDIVDDDVFASMTTLDQSWMHDSRYSSFTVRENRNEPLPPYVNEV